MLEQVSFLSKLFIAVIFRTNKWLFISVYSNVIEKVLSLAYDLLAFDKWALQKLNQALTIRILYGESFEDDVL